MMLNNLKNYLRALHLVGAIGYDSARGSVVDMPGIIKDTSGNECKKIWVRTTGSYLTIHVNLYPFTKMDAGIMTSESYGYTNSNGILFGSGAAEVSEDDYSLENPVISGLSIIDLTQNKSYSIVDGKYVNKITFSFGLKNTTSNNKTVSEVGFYQKLLLSPDSSVMLHREVFDPVIIEPSAYASFSFEITIENSIE